MENLNVIGLIFTDGSKYWIAAPSMEAARKWYDLEGDYALDGSETWKQLSEEEIDDFKVSLANFQSEAPGDGWPDTMPLREFIKDCTLYNGETPEIICSTDYD